MSPSRHLPFHGRAFTLIELLAVMIVLSIMLVSASFGYRMLATSARQAASQTLLAALDAARAEAVSRNEPWPLLFRQGSQFASPNSFNEYGTLHSASGSDASDRRVAWHTLPNGAWVFGGSIPSISKGKNILDLARTTLADSGVTASEEEMRASVTAIVFGEMGEMSFPEGDGGPYYLAIAEGNPDATGGSLRSIPDLIEIRPATGRVQLISP